MAENLDILVRLDATLDELNKAMKGGDRRVQQFERSVNRNARNIERRFDRMGRSVNRAVRGILPVLSGAALVQGARRAIDYADAIGTASDRLGVGVEFLQEFRFAAEDSSNASSRHGLATVYAARRRSGAGYG
jgi:hypothetical protein